MDAADAPVITTFVAPAGVRRPAIDHEAVVIDAFEAHAGRLTAFARAAARDTDAGDDLVQETFLRFIRQVRSDDIPENVPGWLFRVCANLVVSRGRRRSVAERMKGMLIDRRVGPSPEDASIRADERERVHDALQTLPADARVALLMAAEGYSSQEIATAIGRSVSATRAYLCRARIRLRELLVEREP